MTSPACGSGAEPDGGGGGGGGAVTLITVDVADVRPVAANVTVWLPDPVMERFVKLATPLAFVITLRVPFRVPLPLAMDAVTTRPDWPTGLFDASRTCTTGCCAKAAPLCADAEGCCVI